jgi:hypothetical protein
MYGLHLKLGGKMNASQNSVAFYCSISVLNPVLLSNHVSTINGPFDHLSAKLFPMSAKLKVEIM